MGQATNVTCVTSGLHILCIYHANKAFRNMDTNVKKSKLINVELYTPL